MKTKIRLMSVMSVMAFLITFSIPKESHAVLDWAAMMEIVEKKCMTNGYHTGWYNGCSPGFSRCLPTNCTPAEY